MKIAIFGGTFNPVHKGHLNCLFSITEKINFDKIIILPDKIPPHKNAEELACAEDRINMCRLAFEGIDGAYVSDWEIKQKGKSYSVITLRHYHEIYPEDKLYFIMGSDMLLSFRKWYCYEEILELATLVCISRDELDDYDKLEQYADELTLKKGEVIIIHAKPFEASSTMIRKMIHNNDDCSCYLDKNVVQYIMKKNLYNEVI